MICRRSCTCRTRYALLREGRIHLAGLPGAFVERAFPVVRQFIDGRDGPLPVLVTSSLSEEAMKMKGQLNVKTPAEYIAAVDDKRRSDIAALDALIRKHAPKLEPVIMGGMLGYGPFHYRYASGREGDACKLSIASNASYISLYCFAADAKGYVAERYVDRLPKASIGKACVGFKKLADLDEKALVALIKETAKMGLVA